MHTTHVTAIAQPTPWPIDLAIDWGIADPATIREPQPTPEQTALAILAPHLANEPRYQS